MAADYGRTDGVKRIGLVAWCLYDWANSAYPTVIQTFVFAAYFTQAVASSPNEGTSAWGTAVSIAALVIALFSPVLGAVADHFGRRKPWLLVFTAVCAVAAGMLWFTEPSPNDALWALSFVVIATIGFEFGMVFYNSMLPDIAPSGYIGRLSGWAWSLGYAGGLVCLALALVGFVQTETPWFGLGKADAEHVRATTLLVAVWVAVFSAPIFVFTPDRPASGIRLRQAVVAGVSSLIKTFRQLRKYAHIARFLLARMIYTDGLNTLFAFGGIYAAGTFGMDFAEIIQFGIALNVTAGLGAAAFAWVDDAIGAKRTLVIALSALVLLGGAILAVENKTAFWLLGLLIGIFFGPAQAASRSMMARLAPADMRTEMFGLYAFTGKATAFLGPALFGWATVTFDSQRAGMSTVLLFLILGLVLLVPVREPVQG